MTPGTTYSPQKDFGLLLIGPPLSGKTYLAMRFPKPYIISTDHKIANAVKDLRPGEWWFDYVDQLADGTPVLPEDRWTRATNLLKEGIRNTEVQTIIWDNLSDMSACLQDHIIAHGGTKLVVGGERVFEQQHWQPFKLLMSRAIATGRGSRKFFIVCCHEQQERDEGTGIITTVPLIPGQLRGNLGAYFTDVWHTEIEKVGGKLRYYARTWPTSRISLGNSLSLPETFDFSWSEVEKRLAGIVQ